MSEEIDVKRTGESLMELAESLTLDDSEVTADEIVDKLEGRLLSAEEAGDIRRWLNT